MELGYFVQIFSLSLLSYWLFSFFFFFWFYHDFFLKDVNNSGAFYNFLSTNSDFKELFTEVRQIRYARADTVGLLTFVQLIVFYKFQKNCRFALFSNFKITMELPNFLVAIFTEKKLNSIISLVPPRKSYCNVNFKICIDIKIN